MQRNIGYRVYLVNYGGEGEKGREKERYREREKAGDPLALEIRGKIGNEQGLFLKGTGHPSDRPGQQICFYIF